MAQILRLAVGSLFGVVSAARQKFAEEWGESIDWVPYEVGIVKAKREGKILMAIVQQDDCRNCEKLKSVFKKNKEVHKLSRFFVMTNISAEEVERFQEFHPDGVYTPRILFFDSDGKLMPGVKRDSRLKEVRYFYNSDIQLVNTMKKVLKDPTRFMIKTDRYSEWRD